MIIRYSLQITASATPYLNPPAKTNLLLVPKGRLENQNKLVEAQNASRP
jgi:hypothetical protein